MKKLLFLFSLIFLTQFSYAETLSKDELFRRFDLMEKKLKENVREIRVEALSYMKMDDNDFTMKTLSVDFIDSLEYSNVMTDNTTKEEFYSSGKSKNSPKTDIKTQEGDFSIFTYSTNTLNGHNLTSVLTESLTLTKENNLIRIVSDDKTSVFLQMLLKADDLSLKSLQFKSYFGTYNVKVVKSRKIADYLTLPDSVEVFLNEKFVMHSKAKDIKVKFK
ncbi:MAG: hypothetical protein PHW02_01245 [bacterium]|nr:hypothetical protein [bacterium]